MKGLAKQKKTTLLSDTKSEIMIESIDNEYFINYLI